MKKIKNKKYVPSVGRQLPRNGQAIPNNKKEEMNNKVMTISKLSLQ